MQPSRMLVLGFSIIILTGATLLFLPISSKSGQFSSFIDCLFTATSATCVTGITVLDTFNYFNGFGQGVILALIQVGGLGFLTLVTFINLILGKKLGWSTVKIAASDLTDNALETTPKRLFYEIVLYSFAIEFVGAVILSFVFVPDFGALGIFEAIFLSVSAFCNAGFDLLTATPGAIFSKMSILLSRIPPVLSVCTVPFITADMPSDISYSFVSSAVTATGTVIFSPV